MDHLQPDFRPQSKTIAVLRGLLLQHDIICPTNARKHEIVTIWESQLRPRSAEILAELSNALRTDVGIRNAESSPVEDSSDVDFKIVASDECSAHLATASSSPLDASSLVSTQVVFPAAAISLDDENVDAELASLYKATALVSLCPPHTPAANVSMPPTASEDVAAELEMVDMKKLLRKRMYEAAADLGAALLRMGLGEIDDAIESATRGLTVLEAIKEMQDELQYTPGRDF